MLLFGSFSSRTSENILESLKAVYLGDIYIQEERVAVVKFGMDYGCSILRGLLIIMYETTAGEMSDTFGEAKVWVENYT